MKGGGFGSCPFLLENRMPYKPTGRAPGRPRKNPLAVEASAEQQAPKPVSARPRARSRFRMLAELQNPSPFVQAYDGRGRPRHKPRHSSVKA